MMEQKNQKQLEEAKALFYSLRLVEAYNIFRRFFDRLPFKPEPGHSEYIGMFARILIELGKEYELKFYLGELERLYEKIKTPGIAFQLAVVYLHLSEPKMERARHVIEGLLRDPQAAEFHIKAKILLIFYYNRMGDISSCRLVLDSITGIPDVFVKPLLEIWRAKILINEKRLEEGKEVLEGVLAELAPKRDWYPYVSSKILLAELLIKEGDINAAKVIRSEIKKMFEGRHFRSVQLQLQGLEELLKNQTGLEVIRVRIQGEQTWVSYSDKALSVTKNRPSERLLLLLAEKKYVAKPEIIQALYEREYDGEKDDKLIYYQVHSLRKCLKILGLPSEAVVSDAEGYRLVPEVQWVKESTWVGEERAVSSA